MYAGGTTVALINSLIQALEPIPIKDRHFKKTSVLLEMARIVGSARYELRMKPTLPPITLSHASMVLALSGMGKGYSQHILESLLSGSTKVLEQYHLKTQKELIVDRFNEGGDPNIRVKSPSDFGKEVQKMGGIDPSGIDKSNHAALTQNFVRLQYAKAYPLFIYVDEFQDKTVQVSEIVAFMKMAWDSKIRANKTKTSDSSKSLTPLSGVRVPSITQLIGTPSITDDMSAHDNLITMLKNGLARRMFFSLTDSMPINELESPEVKWQKLGMLSITKSEIGSELTQLTKRLVDRENKNVYFSDDTGVAFMALENEMMIRSSEELDLVIKPNLLGAPYRVARLSAILAVIDESEVVEKRHFDEALEFDNESRNHLKKIVKKKQDYEILVSYLLSQTDAVTETTIIKDLGSKVYPSSGKKREDILSLAASEAISSGSVLTTALRSGVLFIQCQKLTPSSLDKIRFSFSFHMAYGYKSYEKSFETLVKAISTPDLKKRVGQICSHGFNDNHRSHENVIKGFNMIILDIDQGKHLNNVINFYSLHYNIIYTTKRHNPSNHRFRVIIPLDSIIFLDKGSYSRALKQYQMLLPFPCDIQAGSDIAKTWATHQGICYVNTSTDRPLIDREENQSKLRVTLNHPSEIGLFDSKLIIPDTLESVEIKKNIRPSEKNSDRLIEWFKANIAVYEGGGRNSFLFKFGMAVATNGLNSSETESQILAMNHLFSTPLPSVEVRNIIKSVNKRST